MTKLEHPDGNLSNLRRQNATVNISRRYISTTPVEHEQKRPRQDKGARDEAGEASKENAAQSGPEPVILNAHELTTEHCKVLFKLMLELAAGGFDPATVRSSDFSFSSDAGSVKAKRDKWQITLRIPSEHQDEIVRMNTNNNLYAGIDLVSVFSSCMSVIMITAPDLLKELRMAPHSKILAFEQRLWGFVDRGNNDTLREILFGDYWRPIEVKNTNEIAKHRFGTVRLRLAEDELLIMCQNTEHQMICIETNIGEPWQVRRLNKEASYEVYTRMGLERLAWCREIWEMEDKLKALEREHDERRQAKSLYTLERAEEVSVFVKYAQAEEERAKDFPQEEEEED